LTRHPGRRKYPWLRSDTALLPGEDHINLKPDPYYGAVDVGDAPTRTLETPRHEGARLQREINAGRHALDGHEQNRIEVLTGKRLQQREPTKREDLPPVEEEPTPEVTSLEPNTVALGSESFTLHVKGSGFTDFSRIVFNGGDEMTQFVSDSELTTEVNMATAGTATAVPVAVRNEELLSNEMPFTFTAAESGGERGGSRASVAGKPVPQPRAVEHKSERGGRDDK
jgi:hypothetical protein